MLIVDNSDVKPVHSSYNKEKSRQLIINKTLKFSEEKISNKKEDYWHNEDVRREANRYGFFQDKKASQFLFKTELPELASTYHENYIGYLSHAWAKHESIVIAPKYLWFTVLMEIAAEVKDDPEAYRKLFSTTDEKQEIIVPSGEVIDLECIADILKSLVPTDSSLFLPTFSQTDYDYDMAALAAFCDTCSPFYNYSCFCCNFPKIKIEGIASDYQLMADNVKKLKNLFIGLKRGTLIEKLFTQAQSIFSDIAYALGEVDADEHLTSSKYDKSMTEKLGSNGIIIVEDKKKGNRMGFLRNQNGKTTNIWKEMFRLERCGSGSDVEVRGWITELFREKVAVGYPTNYPSHTARVDYKHLTYNKTYSLCHGLYYSDKDNDGFLVPKFSWVCNEDLVTTI